jgi:hypothetical protein
MALKSYLITHDVKSPYVVATGLPHNPQEVRLKLFRKGQVVKGELKHANNKPAFLLVNGVCVIGLDVVKELVTKEIGSNASGGTTTSPSKVIDKTIGLSKDNSNPKVRYIDAMIVGALLGVAGVFIAEKQGWVEDTDKKYKLYGAIGGAIVGYYFMYRKKTQKPNFKITKTDE